jgi:SAM-dependent methyltransferase
MLHVAAKLHVADLLAAGPMTIDQLADATRAHAESLRRMLRALAGAGIFYEDRDGIFRLTRLGTYLREGVPGSQWAFAASIGEQWWWAPWGRLSHSVQTGKAAFDCIYGEGLFDYLRKNEAASVIFNANMRAMTEAETQGIVAAYDFSQSQLIADIGGGTGTLLFDILKFHPEVRGILFDDPAVVAEAQTRFDNLEIGQRCSFVPGNFFLSVPPGADTYLLKDILHDWDDQHAIELLQKLRVVMHSGSKLLVIERLIVPDNQPSRSKGLDIAMLVLTGGKERTREHYRDLLASAGFSLRCVTGASLGISLMEASPS